MSEENTEKGSVEVTQNQAERELVDQQGYIVDTAGGIEGSLKTAKDGHTVLLPQPTDDPADPLNWSPFKKHLVLLIISWAAFLPDYGSATGAVTLIPQAAEWNMTPDEVNHSQAGNVFMLGVGGVFTVALSAYFGRLPVLFWFLVVAVATAAWCAGATTFESFMAARILNGFFSTVAQGGGLMFIQDIFFFHERARKINVWAGFFILSPYFGPLFAAFITTTQKWQWPFGVYTIMSGLALIGVALFVPETYFNRHISQRPAANGSRIATLIGTHQRKVDLLAPNTFFDACYRPVTVLLKPTVFLSCVYYCLTFAWVVGINTTLSIFLTPLYNFGALQIGYFYFTPIVAAGLGEIAGHWLHDTLARRYIKKHNGHFEPEVRLQASLIATPFMVAGLTGIGFALSGTGYHYMVTALFWGLYVFGVMVTTVGLNSYNLDSYPDGSGEVACWLNMSRVLGGFIISYFQVSWAEAMGTRDSFGIQAGILAGAAIIVPILMKWGKSMRAKSGALDFKTV